MSKFNVGDTVRLKDGIELCCGDQAGDTGEVVDIEPWWDADVVVRTKAGNEHGFGDDELELVRGGKPVQEAEKK